jgi:hypothetical protein
MNYLVPPCDFSNQIKSRSLSSGMLRRVVWQELTDISGLLDDDDDDDVTSLNCGHQGDNCSSPR